MIAKAFLLALENSELMILLPRIYPTESVQFVMDITLFLYVLIFWKCRLVNAYYLLEIISVALIVWPFSMSKNYALALTFAIFANKNIIILHSSESSTRERRRAGNCPVNPYSTDRFSEIPRPPAQKRNNEDNCPSTSTTTRSFYNFATHLQFTSSSTVLLGTAQVNIKLNNAIVCARTLIDPASHATFIARKLQRKLLIWVFVHLVGVPLIETWDPIITASRD